MICTISKYDSVYSNLQFIKLCLFLSHCITNSLVPLNVLSPLSLFKVYTALLVEVTIFSCSSFRQI